MIERSGARARFEKLRSRDLESSMAGFEFQLMVIYFKAALCRPQALTGNSLLFANDNANCQADQGKDHTGSKNMESHLSR